MTASLVVQWSWLGSDGHRDLLSAGWMTLRLMTDHRNSWKTWPVTPGLAARAADKPVPGGPISHGNRLETAPRIVSSILQDA